MKQNLKTDLIVLLSLKSKKKQIILDDTKG